MKAIRFLKGMFGFCQVEGCRNRYDYLLGVESDGKKISSTKICEDCAIELLTGKKPAQPWEGEKV